MELVHPAAVPLSRKVPLNGRQTLLALVWLKSNVVFCQKLRWHNDPRPSAKHLGMNGLPAAWGIMP